MASMTSTQSIATLRAVLFRINSASPEQLPLVASQISGLIWNCRSLLSQTTETLGTKNEAATLVHRFKNRIASLLQDRTVEARWAAVVLTKALVEAGGVEVLSKSNAWVRSLLAILKKSEPATTKRLAIITLVRIFTLTWEYSNLVREITAPALPGFISACLLNVKKEQCSAAEFQTILEAFTTLVPRHPTIFRTHEVEIRTLLIQILSSDSRKAGADSHIRYSALHKELAQRLAILLHHCAPKQGGSEAWHKTFQAAIVAAHTTCDHLFRSVIEDWQSTTGIQKDIAGINFAATEAEYAGVDAIGLPAWQGMLAGRDRLVIILGLLTSQLQTATGVTVQFRIGLLVELLTRLLSLAAPTTMDSSKSNPQIPKDERETLFAILPSVHHATLELCVALVERCGTASVSFVHNLLDLIVDIHRTESFDDSLRSAVHLCLERIILIVGPSMSKEGVSELAAVIQRCCDDLLPADAQSSPANGVLDNPEAKSKDLTMQSNKSHAVVCAPTQASQSASALLVAVVNKLNTASLSRKLRVKIERIAVLTRNKQLLLACVMNPARKDVGGKLQPSLLPLLAREFPDAPEVEALVRPRMVPVAHAGPRDADVANAYEEEENDVEEGEDMELQENGTFGEDIDPTKGLLDSLAKSSEVVSQDAEELYAVSPRITRTQPNGFINSTQSLPTKRPADSTSSDLAESTKRRRASPPAANTPTEHPTSAFLAAQHLAAESGHSDITAHQNSSSQADFHSAASQQTVDAPSPLAAGYAGPGGNGDSDDSDFEMPPLTMELDTDEEEDGDGDEE